MEKIGFMECKNCKNLVDVNNHFECIDCGKKYCKSCAEKNKMICTNCYNEIKHV